MTDAKPTPNDRQIGSSDITPPPALVMEWVKTRALLGDDTPLHTYIANRASRWGSDQELEACCEWLKRFPHFEGIEDQLCAARRPEPPSLKEQALLALDDVAGIDGAHYNAIRRALEALPDD